ncbi:MAG TPA: winged helix-turn-helix domain-containing protein [Polyangiaceae bacterium]|nr:winged helix-turn-helix domain-containing protein [Polyangiaceae bacterium]
MTNDASMADPRGVEADPGSIGRASDVIAFGEFTAHLRSAELFRAGAPIKLQLQPFRVLATLLRRPGELVTRDELRREIWGDHTAVDFEQGLNFCIKQVRAALGDNAEQPSFIETLPRRGYRFIGAIERAAVRAPAAPSARIAWLAFLGVFLASLALAVFALRARSVRDPNAANVVFVVPFENMTGDPGKDVWCDGLTEEIIAGLASADPGRVQVIARTTSLAYRAARQPLREIAARVKADYALEGAVRKVDDGLRVTAQLYRLQEQTPVWAKAFEATGTDVLSIQRELALNLAGSLAIAVDPAETPPASPAPAQEALAKARYLRNKNDPNSVGPALAAYEEALRIDPQNAVAWGELAMAYDAAAGVVPASEALDKSCAAAHRAHELSPREALGDTALGLCALQRDWNWAAAETAFGNALARNPGLAAAHHYFAAFLSAAGRHREAIRAIERAKALDPLSPAIVSDAGWHAYLGREYPAAIREFERTLELEPKDAWSREHLMMARALAGDAVGAAKEAAAWATLFPLGDEEKTALAATPADAVRRTTEVIAKRLAGRAMAGDTHPNPGFVAVKYAGAADRAEALSWLERAASQHSPWFLPLLRDPRFDSLRDDARFAAILQRAHVPVGESRP